MDLAGSERAAKTQASAEQLKVSGKCVPSTVAQDGLRWSSRVFPGCKDICDLSEYYCPYDWSRHIEPP